MSNQNQKSHASNGAKDSGKDYPVVGNTAARLPTLPEEQARANYWQQGSSIGHRGYHLEPLHGSTGRGGRHLSHGRGGRGGWNVPHGSRGGRGGRSLPRGRCGRGGWNTPHGRGGLGVQRQIRNYEHEFQQHRLAQGDGRHMGYDNERRSRYLDLDYDHRNYRTHEERQYARFCPGNRINPHHTPNKKRKGYDDRSHPDQRRMGQPCMSLDQTKKSFEQPCHRGNAQSRVKIEDTYAPNEASRLKSSLKTAAAGSSDSQETSNPSTQAGIVKAKVKTETSGQKSCLRRNSKITGKSNALDQLQRKNAMILETRVSQAASSHVGTIDQGSVSPKTHVIFAIDFSGSMKEMDVKTSNGIVSRWEAVFTCMDSFLTQQLHSQNESEKMSHCVVSVFLFNDQTQVILESKPLTGQGNDIRQILQKARTTRKPNGGTGFSAAFQQAEQLAYSNIHDKVVLAFLSDGRPGDLRPRHPLDSAIAMQTTFKRNGAVLPAAGTYISNMQKRHPDFNLQLICLCSEGVGWLTYLASRYNGTFHNPDLALDDSTNVLIVPTSTATDNNGCENDILEVQVKSATIVRRERYDGARGSNEVISLTNATSLGSTFSSISATVTAMRSGTKLLERQVIIKKESVMISYKATRMVLVTDNGIDKCIVAPGEGANERRIELSMNPFAQGGLRNVYYMKQKNESRRVAKESRHDIVYNERLKFHLETVKCQTHASQYACCFNERIKNLNGSKKKQKQQHDSLTDVPIIAVLRAEVYRLKARSCPGGFRYLAVEDYLEGKYEKWNNNDGFVNKRSPDSIQCKVAQAFSHFSYESSKRQKIVVDIQGSGNVYTDPQLHSIEKEFGRADRGNAGIEKFFKTHKCNFICRELGLQTCSPVP